MPDIAEEWPKDEKIMVFKLSEVKEIASLLFDAGIDKEKVRECLVMAIFGGWNLDDVKGCNLPQKVQSAFTAVTGDLTGADYEPIAYLGSQKVNGTNYRVLALQRLVIPENEKRIVKMIINEELDGTVRLVSVSGLAL